MNLTYWYIILLLSLSSIIFILVFRQYKIWSDGWLSALINKDISRHKKEKQEKKYKNLLTFIKELSFYFFVFIDNLRFYPKNFVKQIKTIYTPSIASLIIFLIFSALIFFIDYSFNSNSNNLYSEISEKENNYLGILTGLSAIIIALVIFIAESVRNAKDKMQKKLLLKETQLWPLTVIIILSFLNFIYLESNFLSILLILLVAAFSLYAFYKGIKITLDPQRINKQSKELFKDRIKLIMNDSILERVGNNLLFQKLGCDKEIKIEHTISKAFILNEDKYIYIKSDKEGYIKDIHLSELKKFTEKLEKEANKLGFSIYNEKKLFLNNQKAKNKSQDNHSQTTINVKKVYLLKRYRDYLSKDTIFNKDGKVILAIPEEFNKNKELIVYINNTISQIFKFKKEEAPSEELKRELNEIKIKIIKAINENNTVDTEDSTEIYLDVAECFLSELQKFGGGFSSEQAKQERTAFLNEEWNEINWIHKDIWNLINVAITSDNKDIIRSIIYLPFIISIIIMM